MPWTTAWQLASSVGRRPLLELAALAVAQALLPLAGLVAMQRLLDAVAAGIGGTLPPTEAMAAASLAVALAAGIALVGSLVQARLVVRSEVHGRELADATTQRVQEHAATLDLGDFDQPECHERMQRAGAEAATRPVRLVQDGVAVLVAGIGMLAMAGWLLLVEPWLPLVVVASALPVAFVRQRHAADRLRWQQQNVGAQRDVGYTGALLTGRATAPEVRVLGVAAWLGQRLGALRAGLRQSLATLARRRSRDEVWVAAVRSAGLFGAYFVLARAALAGGLSLGELVLHAQAAQRAQNGVRDLLAALAAGREHRQFLRPVVEFLSRGPAVVATPPPRTPPPGPLALAASDVGFRYAGGPREALDGVTFTIAAGEYVGVLGGNGSGKSTLVKLLARLYDPSVGRLEANGVDLRHCEPAAWRARLSVLTQDGSLLELSVRENLELGRSAPATDAEIARVLAVVGLEEAVARLPAGLATPCSRRIDGGVDWSSGEQRRLRIARALLRRADLLVLDEPFAGLDAGSVATVAAHLRTLPGTRIVVEHRLEPLRHCDRILVLRDGRLVAHGTPAELAATDPAFASLRPPR